MYKLIHDTKRYSAVKALFISIPPIKLYFHYIYLLYTIATKATYNITITVKVPVDIVLAQLLDYMY